MNVVVIASFGDSKYRLLDKNTMSVLDVPFWKIKKALERNLINIENMKLKNDRLVCKSSNCRVSSLNEDGDIIGGPTITVIYQVSDVGYITVDHEGKPSCMTINELIGHVISYGASNIEFGRSGSSICIDTHNYKFDNFEVDAKTLELLINKERNMTKLNAKIGLLGYPYRIYGDTIDIISEDFEKINIVEPVSLIVHRRLNNCDRMKEITVPPTLKELDVFCIMACRGLRIINMSRKTKITNTMFNPTILDKIKYYD